MCDCSATDPLFAGHLHERQLSQFCRLCLAQLRQSRRCSIVRIRAVCKHFEQIEPCAMLGLGELRERSEWGEAAEKGSQPRQSGR